MPKTSTADAVTVPTTDAVTVPRRLLLQVIGMAKCETERLDDHPRKGLVTTRHKADCRPCALHDLAKPT